MGVTIVVWLGQNVGVTIIYGLACVWVSQYMVWPGCGCHHGVWSSLSVGVTIVVWLGQDVGVTMVHGPV